MELIKIEWSSIYTWYGPDMGQRGSILPKWCPNLELGNSGTNQDRIEFYLHMVWSEWVREEAFYQNDVQI